MYKEITRTIIILIFNPVEAWKQLVQYKDKDLDGFQKHYLYPLFGLVVLAAFLGLWINIKGAGLENSLKKAIQTAVFLLGGFYFAVYLLNELWIRIFHRDSSIELLQKFVGYSSSLLFAVNMMMMLIPQLFFLLFFLLYTFKIVWEGADIYLQVEQEERMKFSVLASCCILGCPYIVYFVLLILMPGLAG